MPTRKSINFSNVYGIEVTQHRAEQNASKYINRSLEDIENLRKKKWIDSRKQVYFHLQSHPENPPSRAIQDLWKQHVSHPSDNAPLSQKRNLAKER
ncbi:hypothetical protein ACHAXN_001446, partial [Cyclotella atomus]